MAKTDETLSSLLKTLSSQNAGGLSLSDSLRLTSLIGQATSASERVAKPPSIGGIKTSSMDAKDSPTGIQFGRPSSTKSAATTSSNELLNLLKQTASGGIASALGGGLGSIAGLGGIVSGIMSLFGGHKSTPPPLVEFQLPETSSETIYVSSKGNTTYQGADVEQSSISSTGTGIYSSGTSTSQTSSSSQALQYQSSQIAQAVKNALLNSSSLNDVIAEI